MKTPVHPERFESSVRTIERHWWTMKVVRPMMVMNLRAVMLAYHGSTLRVCWYFLSTGFFFWRHEVWYSTVMWVTDKAGWTKMCELPCGVKVRHGRRCSRSPNCSNPNCIDDSVPMWFKRLTRWETL